jgi:myo-inositol-1(or 4)-monophosphatase
VKAREVPWEKLLVDASERVLASTSAVALKGERGVFVGMGASGDRTTLADKVAEDALLKALGTVEGLRVLSEEAGEVGDRSAKTLAVVDPLDGSSNFIRGIPFYCTSVAIVEGPSLEDVSFGLVRNLVSGDVYSAWRGKGATKNGAPIRTSALDDPSKSVVGVDVSRGEAALVARLAPLIGSAGRVVHFGANALELCLLAEGNLEAFVDLRGRMRVTDFAAAFLIAREAGASISDSSGRALEPALDLAEGFSFVASANVPLHARILGLLG